MSSNPGGSYDRGDADEWEPTKPNSAFSPPVIALVAVIASAFLIVSYYSYFLQRCKPRFWRIRTRDEDEVVVQDSDGLQNISMACGLEEAVMKKIPVCKYRKGDVLIEGTECAVCLVDFQENENLRFLPKCCHAFHIDCIDMWLRSHANCPLCRSNVIGSSANIALLDEISSVINSTDPEIISSGGQNLDENREHYTLDSAINSQEELYKTGEDVRNQAADEESQELGIFETLALRRSLSLGSYEQKCFSTPEFMRPESTFSSKMNAKMLMQPALITIPSCRTERFMWTETRSVSRWKNNDNLSILMQRLPDESTSCCDIRSDETLIDMTRAYSWRSLDSLKNPCNKTTSSRLRSGDPEALLSPRTFNYNHHILKLP